MTSIPEIKDNGIKQFYRIFCDGKEKEIINADKSGIAINLKKLQKEIKLTEKRVKQLIAKDEKAAKAAA